MTTEDQRPASHRRGRMAVIGGAMAVFIIGAPLLLYQLSVRPGAALVRWAFEAGEEARPPAGLYPLGQGVSVQVGVPLAVDDAPGATLDIYTAAPASPSSGAGAPIVLWIHGGGFIANDAWMVHAYATKLAAAGYVVASLDYILAPAARYPTPVRQADAALAFLRDHGTDYGGDPQRFVLGGDSAGAQIASQVAAMETHAAFAAAMGIGPALSAGQLQAAILFCGLYDMSTVASTGFPALRTFLWSYTGQRDWERYPRIDELSTTRTARASYPPTYIAVGDADPFDPQSHELAAALGRLGVPVTTRFWEATHPGLGHEYQFALDTPQAQLTLDDVLAFLARQTTADPR